MKKLAFILLLVFVSSCSTTNNMNNKVEDKEVNNVWEQQITTKEIQNDVVELSPDEEKIVEDLLNF